MLINLSHLYEAFKSFTKLIYVLTKVLRLYEAFKVKAKIVL